jgi:hypothetical protein
MKTIMYIVVGLVVWLNWDKISGMFKKKDEPKPLTASLDEDVA